MVLVKKKKAIIRNGVVTPVVPKKPQVDPYQQAQNDWAEIQHSHAGDLVVKDLVWLLSGIPSLDLPGNQERLHDMVLAVRGRKAK